jgi:hypothetical protein
LQRVVSGSVCELSSLFRISLFRGATGPDNPDRLRIESITQVCDPLVADKVNHIASFGCNTAASYIEEDAAQALGELIGKVRRRAA